MAALPETESLVTRIDAAVKAALSEPPRAHLGASQIGKPCERALWYGFRWAKSPQFSGRMLRLFNRGHEEEAQFVRWLKLLDGVTVKTADPKGNQFSFSEPATGHHFAGSLDGVCLGLPEAQGTYHVLEFKTHSAKSFKELSVSGVTKAKPEHYAQMQIYMHWASLTRALYMAVNKDDDSLYCERIAYDEQTATALINRAVRIVTSQEPPPKLSDKPDWYQCKWCDFHALCHGRIEEATGGLGPETLPDVHCRTCLHATPELDGQARWSCAKWQADIPVDGQRQGCEEHRYIPALIPWAAVVDATEQGDVVYEIKGESHQPFINGACAKATEVPAYASQELQAMHPRLIGNRDIEELRSSLGGTVEQDPIFIEEDMPW